MYVLLIHLEKFTKMKSFIYLMFKAAPVVGFFLILSCQKELDIQPKIELGDELFSYERTPCFGFCKVYEFKIFKDQSVCYKELNSGNSIRTISPSDDTVGDRSKEIKNCKLVQIDLWNKIKDKAKNLKLHKMAKVYPNDGSEVVDISKSIIKIQLNGELIEIEDSFGAPQELDEFEAYVEELILKFKENLLN